MNDSADTAKSVPQATKRGQVARFSLREIHDAKIWLSGQTRPVVKKIDADEPVPAL